MSKPWAILIIGNPKRDLNITIYSTFWSCTFWGPGPWKEHCTNIGPNVPFEVPIYGNSGTVLFRVLDLQGYSFINFILTLHTSRGYRLSWQLEVFYGVLRLERLTSINRSTSKWLAHKSRLVISSFPSLGLVPIFHCVPMTQLSLAFDKASIENSPITPFHFRNGAWKQ